MVVIRHLTRYSFESSSDMNRLILRCYSRRLPLKDSMWALSVGVPGLENTSWIFLGVYFSFLDWTTLSGGWSNKVGLLPDRIIEINPPVVVSVRSSVDAFHVGDTTEPPFVVSSCVAISPGGCVDQLLFTFQVGIIVNPVFP